MEKTIDPAYTGSAISMHPPSSVANILHIARASAYEFLRSQKYDAAVHGGGWDARELTRLLVHFWTMGYNTVQSDQSASAEVDA